MIVLIGGILGFLAVVMGASVDHLIAERVSQDQLDSLMTAIRYQQIHALIIVTIGLYLAFSSKNPEQIASVKFKKSLKMLSISGYLFIFGLGFFCLGIYLSIGLASPKLVLLTPLGGVILMLAWLLLGFSGLGLTRRADHSI